MKQLQQWVMQVRYPTTMGDASSLSVCRGNHRRDVDWHGDFRLSETRRAA